MGSNPSQPHILEEEGGEGRRRVEERRKVTGGGTGGRETGGPTVTGSVGRGQEKRKSFLRVL